MTKVYLFSLLVLLSSNSTFTDTCVDSNSEENRAEVTCDKLANENMPCVMLENPTVTTECTDVTRKQECMPAKKDSEKTKKILQGFAKVVKHFTKIIMKPENKDEVRESLVGMLEEMFSMTRKRAMKPGQIEEITMDEEALGEMYKIICEEMLNAAQENQPMQENKA